MEGFEAELAQYLLGCSATAARSRRDDHVAELARALRFHGSRDKRHFEYVGYISRLDELQAAILRVLLPRRGRESSHFPRRPPPTTTYIGA